MFDLKDKAQKKFDKCLNKWIVEERDYASSCKEIDGKGMRGWLSPCNRKCHINALTTYNNNNDLKIIPCLYRLKGGNHWAVHFINRDESDGSYIDNSIGGDSINWTYIIFNNNWLKGNLLGNDPSDWLNWMKNDMRDVAFARMNRFDRWLLRNEDVV